MSSVTHAERVIGATLLDTLISRGLAYIEETIVMAIRIGIADRMKGP
jgi:hypothetical protein